jgi:hypothetical protein
VRCCEYVSLSMHLIFINKLRSRGWILQYRNHHQRGSSVCAVATQVLQALEGVSLFAGLDASVCKKLAERAELREFSSGDVICCEGDPGTGLHLVTKGQVQIALADQERARKGI